MTEERSCEEARQPQDIARAAFDEWYESTTGCEPRASTKGRRSAFNAGFRAAWARTPTLPAGAEQMRVDGEQPATTELRWMHEFLDSLGAPRTTYNYLDSEDVTLNVVGRLHHLLDPGNVGCTKEYIASLISAAGDRPPAEREAGSK